MTSEGSASLQTAMRGAGASAVAAQPPQQSLARREEILTVARDLFFARGFAAASMRDLAAGIGLTQAAIYYHFKSKEEILFALVDDFTQLLHQRLLRALHETGDPVEDLRQAVHAHILLNRTHFREIKLVTEDKKLLGPDYTDRVRQSELSVYTLYRDRVAELAQQGLLAPLTPSVIVFNMLATINFTFQWYRPDGPLKLEDIADQTVALLTRGLLAARAPAAAKKTGRRAARNPKARGDIK